MANNVVPLPLRPLSSVTTMSKFATIGRVGDVDRGDEFASSPLTTVFLTVMPPGLVVPETRNCALAVLSKPLPFDGDVEADGALVGRRGSGRGDLDLRPGGARRERVPERAVATMAKRELSQEPSWHSPGRQFCEGCRSGSWSPPRRTAPSSRGVSGSSMREVRAVQRLATSAAFVSSPDCFRRS